MIKSTFDKNNYVENTSQKQAKTITNNTAIKNAVENKTSAGVQKKSINKIVTCKTCAERVTQDSLDEVTADTKEMTKKITETETQQNIEQLSHDHSATELKQHYMSMHISVCPECGKSYIKGAQNSSSTTKDDPATKGSIFDASI